MSSNRTIVGLKRRISSILATANAKQQSHHCGIETVNDAGGVENLGSNRTIVGLKPVLSHL